LVVVASFWVVVAAAAAPVALFWVALAALVVAFWNRPPLSPEWQRAKVLLLLLFWSWTAVAVLVLVVVVVSVLVAAVAVVLNGKDRLPAWWLAPFVLVPWWPSFSMLLLLLLSV